MYIGGTITWSADSRAPGIDADHEDVASVSGTAEAVIHVVNASLLLAERGDGSHYSYDYSDNMNCAASHEEGTLESYVGDGSTDESDYSIGMLNVGGRLGEDLDLQIHMPDYCGSALGSDVGRVPEFDGFPDCEPRGDQLYARFDGVENYVIDCDVIAWSVANENIGTVTGHVSGNLHPLNGLHPTSP